MMRSTSLFSLSLCAPLLCLTLSCSESSDSSGDNDAGNNDATEEGSDSEPTEEPGTEDSTTAEETQASSSEETSASSDVTDGTASDTAASNVTGDSSSGSSTDTGDSSADAGDSSSSDTAASTSGDAGVDSDAGVFDDAGSGGQDAGSGGASGSNAGGGGIGGGGAGGSAGGGAGGGGAGGTDTGGGGAGGADPGPLEAEAETWTWFPLETMRCADGSSSGFGANLVDGSDELVIFLDGGGACTNPGNCALLGTALNFNSTDFDTRVVELAGAGIFQRDDLDNPLAESSWIYVPYCTGDVHAGNHESTGADDLNFVGHQSYLALLTRLRTAFTDLGSVVLAGGSAGGYGTMFNFHDTATTFDEADAVLLNDSGPLLGAIWMSPSFQNLTFGTWEVVDGIPAECPAVVPGAIDLMYDCLATLHPTARFGVVTSDADPVNRSFLGTVGSPMPAQTYRNGVANLVTHLSTLDPWAIFVYPSTTEHVLGLNDPLSSIMVPDPGGTTLSDFMRGVISGTDFGDVVP